MNTSFLKGIGFAVAAALCLGVGTVHGQEEPIIVGSILDETGPISIYGKAMVDATELAIEHINANGGLLGRPLKLVSYDAQSSNAKYTQYARRLAMRDGAVVIMGGITSASREAIRPVVNRTGTLYFYNEQYEGGVCDKNVFLAGIVPSQQLAPLIPWAIEKFGPKVYVLAADYNYGHISTEWVKKYVKEAGGEVIGVDFIPLSVAEFSAIVSKLQSANPDIVLSLLVGGNHIAFYRQFAAAGLGDEMTIVSPTFGLGNEQVVLSPDEAQNIYVAFPYIQSLENPANREFKKMWYEAYGDDYPYITDSAVTVWNGWHLWAKAVEKAGTTDPEAVIEALESGITFSSPSGKIKLHGPSHHLIQSVHIAKTNDEHGFDVIKSVEMVPPAFMQRVCDLIENPALNKQFTPSDLQ